MPEPDLLTTRLRETLEDQARNAPAVDLTRSSLRRADRIRARRRAGAAVAAVAVLAVGVPLGSTVLGPGEPDSRGDRVATSPSATPEPAHHTLAPDPLLTDEDVNPVGRHQGFTRFESASMTQDRLANQCLPRLTTVGSETQRAALWTGPTGAMVVEFVLQMPSAADAEQLVSGLRALPERCGEVPDTHRQTVHQPTTIEVAGADEALCWVVVDEPLPSDPGSQGSWDGVGVARSGNVVVVLAVGASEDPTVDGWERGGWEEYAARTLGLALDRAH